MHSARRDRAAKAASGMERAGGPSSTGAWPPRQRVSDWLARAWLLHFAAVQRPSIEPDDRSTVLDGPFAETKEYGLGS